MYVGLLAGARRGRTVSQTNLLMWPASMQSWLGEACVLPNRQAFPSPRIV